MDGKNFYANFTFFNETFTLNEIEELEKNFFPVAAFKEEWQFELQCFRMQGSSAPIRALFSPFDGSKIRLPFHSLPSVSTSKLRYFKTTSLRSVSTSKLRSEYFPYGPHNLSIRA